MKVLVANDDGIHANGIRTLVEYLSRQFEVYVAAPDRERSATGHALTLHKPIRVDELDMGIPVKKAYSVTGTPSDCVKIALNAILDIKPDIVVSGINHGPNLGVDVLYSGTVSAALEGAIHGLPSVAISLTNGYERMADFSHGAEFLCCYLPKVLEIGMPAKTILNINIPAIPLSEMTGIKLTQLGTRMYTDTYERRVDPRGLVYYWLAGEIAETGEPEGTDVHAIRNNMISVTPVHIDMTNYQVLKDQVDSLEIMGCVRELL
ncbi:MAG: 5'/3'-nucleotidase SurE [Cyanobacteria bacterium]|nr:5'/3'-nucleotidase SurE [Cyanobacteriota bacterium]